MFKAKTLKLSPEEKKLEAVKRQRARQRTKMLAKLADPEWREKQKQAAIASSKRAIEAKKARQQSELELGKSESTSTEKKKRKQKGFGLLGRTPTAKERRHMNEVGKLPCIACYIKGKHNWRISLHHTRGRVDKDCHMYVLPLCDHHHQHAAPLELREKYPWLIPIHADLIVGSKREFASIFGEDDSLLKLVDDLVSAGVESFDGVFTCREIV